MGKGFKTSRVVSVLAMALLLWSAAWLGKADAQILSLDLPNREGVEVGNIIVHSAFQTGVDFESNIFLSEQSEEDDIITYYRPSFGIEVPMQDNRLSLEYDANVAEFSDNIEQSHIDHRMRGLAEIFWTDYEIKISDVYQRYTTRAGSDETGLPSSRQRKWHNTIMASIATELDQLEYKLTYINEMDKYLQKNKPLFGPMNYDDKNYTLNALDTEVGYRFQPKTTFLFNLVGGLINYYSSPLVPDSYYIEGLFGIKGEWFGKLTFNVRGGFKYQEYDGSTFMYDDNYMNFEARGGIDYAASEDDTVRLTFIRTNRDSIHQDMNYYTMDFVAFDYVHDFTDKITSDVYFSWQRNQYPTETLVDGDLAERRDDIYAVGAMLRYDVRDWLSLQVGHEFRKKDSKFRRYNYDDHVTSIRATVGF